MEVAGQHIIETGLDSDPLTVASFCYAYGKLEYWERNVLVTWVAFGLNRVRFIWVRVLGDKLPIKFPWSPQAMLARRSLEVVNEMNARMLCMTLLGLSSACGQMEDCLVT